MGLVGLFRMQWKTPCYELLIKFLKEQGGKYIFARIGEKLVIVYKHILGEVFKISTKGWKE
jgi:hypothetical protein